MEEHYSEPDKAFHQGEAEGPPTDFLTPLVPEDRLHPTFRTLSSAPRYSPAREVTKAMMRFYEDMDGNFIAQTEIWVEPWRRRRRWLAAQRRRWVPQRGQKWMLTGPA